MATRTMTQTQSTLWNLGNQMKLGTEYATSTRNPDAAVRAQFKADRDIRGTRAWAISLAMTLANGNPSDEDCAEVIRVLESR